MKTKIPKPVCGSLTGTCPECSREFSVGLVPGHNDLTRVCACGAVIRLVADYDGYGQAKILRGSVEQVEEHGH